VRCAREGGAEDAEKLEERARVMAKSKLGLEPWSREVRRLGRSDGEKGRRPVEGAAPWRRGGAAARLHHWSRGEEGRHGRKGAELPARWGRRPPAARGGRSQGEKKVAARGIRGVGMEIFQICKGEGSYL
jgi:hypothetical protein